MEGGAYVEMTVNLDSTASDVKVDAGDWFKPAVIGTISRTKWIPAKFNGIARPSRMIFNVHFIVKDSLYPRLNVVRTRDGYHQ